MAIAHDANSSTSGTSKSSLTWSHTCTGSDRVLVVGIALGDLTAGDRQVSSIKYNSVNLTKIAHAPKGNLRSEMWYLLNPATGTNNIVATFGGVNAVAAGGGISLTGVDSMEANNTATGTSTSPSVSVTSVADNSWLLDVLGVESNPSITVGSGQTQRWSQDILTNMRGRGSSEGPKTPAGSVSMSWALGSSKDWAMVAASFAPANVGFSANPPVLAIGINFPNPKIIWDVFLSAINAIASLPNPTAGYSTKPNALGATIGVYAPNLDFRMVTKLLAGYRKTSLAAEARSASFRARQRDTRLITEKRND